MMKPPPENGVGDDSSQSQGQDVERSTTSSPATPAPTPIRGGGAFTSFFDSPMSKLASMFSGLRIGNIFQNKAKVNKGTVDEQGETPEQEESESFNEDAHHDQNESSGVEYEEARLEVGPTGADEEEVEIGNKEEQDQDESIISELETTTNKIMKEGPEIITTTVPAVEIEKEKKDEEPKAVPVVECENVEKEESEIEKVESVEEPKSTPELEIDEARPESIPELEKAKGELQSTPELIETEELKKEEESESMAEVAAEVDESPPECPGCRGCETEDDDQGSSLVVKMSIFDAHSNPPPTTEPLIELPLDKDAAQEMLKPAEIQDMLTLQ